MDRERQHVELLADLNCNSSWCLTLTENTLHFSVTAALHVSGTNCRRWKTIQEKQMSQREWGLTCHLLTLKLVHYTLHNGKLHHTCLNRTQIPWKKRNGYVYEARWCIQMQSFVSITLRPTPHKSPGSGLYISYTEQVGYHNVCFWETVIGGSLHTRGNRQPGQ